MLSSTHIASPLADFVFLQVANDQPWNLLLHIPNEFENNLACHKITDEKQDCNVSLVNIVAFDIQ